MPNWCYTQIIFHGDKNEIEDFHKRIMDYTSKEFVHTDFGEHWLGNVLYGVGLESRIDSEQDGLRCRGSIVFIDDVTCYSETDAVFSVDVESAWIPMIKMWTETINTIGYGTVGLSFMSEEPGNELYQKFDPYCDFPERYYIDSYIGSKDDGDKRLKTFFCKNARYYSYDDELKNCLSELLDNHDSELIELIDATKKYPFKDDDSYICIHEFEELDSLEGVE